jgi:hypothetical protein
MLEFSSGSTLVLDKRTQRYDTKLQLRTEEEFIQTIAEFSAGEGRILKNVKNPMDGYKMYPSFSAEHLLTNGFAPQRGLYQAMADRLNVLAEIGCCTGANLGGKIAKLRGANNSEVSARWHVSVSTCIF